MLFYYLKNCNKCGFNTSKIKINIKVGTILNNNIKNNLKS